MKKKLLGTPINNIISPKAGQEAFSFNDYENVFLYLFTSIAPIIKMSVLPKTGYLPLIIESDTQLRVKVLGSETKKLSVGKLYFELRFDDADPYLDKADSNEYGYEMVKSLTAIEA